MKEAVIKIDLQPGMEIMSDTELKGLITQVMAKDFKILGTITEVSINQKQ